MSWPGWPLPKELSAGAESDLLGHQGHSRCPLCPETSVFSTEGSQKSRGRGEHKNITGLEMQAKRNSGEMWQVLWGLDLFVVSLEMALVSSHSLGMKVKVLGIKETSCIRARTRC